MVGWKDGWVDGWMHEWIDRWVGGWIGLLFPFCDLLQDGEPVLIIFTSLVLRTVPKAHNCSIKCQREGCWRRGSLTEQVTAVTSGQVNPMGIWGPGDLQCFLGFVAM